MALYEAYIDLPEFTQSHYGVQPGEVLDFGSFSMEIEGFRWLSGGRCIG